MVNWINKRYTNGKLDRQDGPASIEYDRDGKIWEEVWYRQDGPTVIRYLDGEIIKEEWYRNGRFVR